MDYAASNSSELKVFFAKSRSPTRRSTEEADRLTEDILQPLVAGDEFEEEEFEGNTFMFFDRESYPRHSFSFTPNELYILYFFY